MFLGKKHGGNLNQPELFQIYGQVVKIGKEGFAGDVAISYETRATPRTFFLKRSFTEKVIRAYSLILRLNIVKN